MEIFIEKHDKALGKFKGSSSADLFKGFIANKSLLQNYFLSPDDKNDRAFFFDFHARYFSTQTVA